eukprot:gene12577-33024_t
MATMQWVHLSSSPLMLLLILSRSHNSVANWACEVLFELGLPALVTIGSQAFRYFTGTVSFAGTFPFLKSIGNIAFDTAGKGKGTNSKIDFGAGAYTFQQFTGTIMLVGDFPLLRFIGAGSFYNAGSFFTAGDSGSKIAIACSSLPADANLTDAFANFKGTHDPDREKKECLSTLTRHTTSTTATTATLAPITTTSTTATTTTTTATATSVTVGTAAATTTGTKTTATTGTAERTTTTTTATTSTTTTTPTTTATTTVTSTATTSTASTTVAAGKKTGKAPQDGIKEATVAENDANAGKSHGDEDGSVNRVVGNDGDDGGVGSEDDQADLSATNGAANGSSVAVIVAVAVVVLAVVAAALFVYKKRKQQQQDAQIGGVSRSGTYLTPVANNPEYQTSGSDGTTVGSGSVGMQGNGGYEVAVARNPGYYGSVTSSDARYSEPAPSLGDYVEAARLHTYAEVGDGNVSSVEYATPFEFGHTANSTV